MSAFTFTAPTVSEEEERQERSALSDDERNALHEDVYGPATIMAETPDMLENGRVLVEEALAAIPLSEKTSYLAALAQCPELVARESNSLAFLRATRWDAWQAARRLTEYWNARERIFGSNAFLPMTMQGAMRDEMVYLRKAIVMPLEEDAHGRPVLFLDRMRCTKEVAPRDSVVRCFWYAIQTLAENEDYQRKGIVCIVNMRAMDLYRHFDRIMSKKFLWCGQHMPIAAKAGHLCTGSGASVTGELILPVLKQMAGKELRLRTHLHAGSTSEILEHFEQFGLGKVHVDPVFGGFVSNSTLLQAWLDGRAIIERARANGGGA